MVQSDGNKTSNWVVCSVIGERQGSVLYSRGEGRESYDQVSANSGDLYYLCSSPVKEAGVGQSPVLSLQQGIKHYQQQGKV